MATRTPHTPGKSIVSKVKVHPKAMASRKPSRRGRSESQNQTPIPQKALIHAVSLTQPPAISDEVPDEMPFPTGRVKK